MLLSPKNFGHNYDPEKEILTRDEESEEEADLLEEDLSAVLDRLSDKSVKALQGLGEEYGIADFLELLRSEKEEMEQRQADEAAGLKVGLGAYDHIDQLGH